MPHLFSKPLRRSLGMICQAAITVSLVWIAVGTLGAPLLAAEPVSEEEMVYEIQVIDGLLAAEQWSEAARFAENLLARSKNSTHAWQIQERWGLALYAQGRPEESLPHFEAAIRAASQEYSPHLNLATALMALGRRGRAFSEYRDAVELDPSNWRARLDYGQALQEFGMIDDARRQLESAAQACGGCLPVMRAQAHLHLDAGEYAAAVGPLESLYASEPDHEVRQNLATAYMEIQDSSGLRRLLEPLWPRGLSSQEKTMLLEVDRTTGETARALEAVSAVKIADSWDDRAIFWGIVSLICQEGGYDQEALVAVDQAIALEPGNATYRNNRVVLLTNLGRHEEAEQEWQQVIEIAPELQNNQR